MAATGCLQFSGIRKKCTELRTNQIRTTAEALEDCPVFAVFVVLLVDSVVEMQSVRSQGGGDGR